MNQISTGHGISEAEPERRAVSREMDKERRQNTFQG